jgi:eukaryotic-like serine/threonine-protein kinase
MAIVTNDALLDVLQRCNLLAPEQLGKLRALLDHHEGDASEVSKTLVERNWLTSFQANQLLLGRSEELVVGPYIIIDRLSKSSRSEVYKARHVESECVVALKVIRADRLATPIAVNRFLQEMAALAELEHPNIVQCWDGDKAGEAYYCAMEFVEGTNLATLVEVHGRLSVPVAADHIRQAALGLQCAYEHNFVHRDIKPVNLFLTQPTTHDSGCIKILDWSLATLRRPGPGGEEQLHKSSEHALIGTADYLSPEQAMNPESVDIRGDIYSLGCTLYFLLTGKTPFQGASVMQKALQHMSAEAEPVEKLNPEVPRRLANMVRRMMAKQPKERFQTPAAVALALVPFCPPKSTAFEGRVRAPDDTPMPPPERF